MYIYFRITINCVSSAGCAVYNNNNFLSVYLFFLQKTIRNPYVDIFVAIITVPSLILLALLLDANIRENIDSEDHTGTNSSPLIVLIFGFGFLVMSLLACGCIMHKMGMCLWMGSLHTDNDESPTNINNRSGIHCNSHCSSSSNSRRSNECSHIIDMPPSYETIMNGYKCDLVATNAVLSLPRMSINAPPPTYESLGHGQRLAHEMPPGAISIYI